MNKTTEEELNRIMESVSSIDCLGDFFKKRVEISSFFEYLGEKDLEFLAQKRNYHIELIDKIFSKTLQSKFKWAFDVNSDWKF